MAKAYRSIYIDPELMEHFDKLADDNFQTRNRRLEMLVRRDLEQNGMKVEARDERMAETAA